MALSVQDTFGQIAGILLLKHLQWTNLFLLLKQIILCSLRKKRYLIEMFHSIPFQFAYSVTKSSLNLSGHVKNMKIIIPILNNPHSLVKSYSTKNFLQNRFVQKLCLPLQFCNLEFQKIFLRPEKILLCMQSH